MAEMTPSTSGWKTRPLYTRVAIVGLLLHALVSLVWAVLTIIDVVLSITGTEASNIAFFIIPTVLSLIFAGLMWRFGKWALVVTALWGLLNLSWGTLKLLKWAKKTVLLF